MKIKVSVIIPVYNAEKYLSKAIESLRNNTLDECEFIFVNDGSEDKSLEILNFYASLDKRIKVLSELNSGVSCARNTGLSIARGEYVGFMDADDWVKPEMYEILYASAVKSGTDVVLSNLIAEHDGLITKVEYPFEKNRILKKDEIRDIVLPYFLKEDNLNSVVNKLYKNEILKKNKIAFPVGIELGEDCIFNLKFFSGADTMYYLDYAGYRYRDVFGSATRNIMQKDYFKRALEFYEDGYEKLIDFNLDQTAIKKLKAIKLINYVKSYTYIYLQGDNRISFNERYGYVSKMIKNTKVKEALKLCWKEIFPAGTRYEKFLLLMIKYRLTELIVLATAYSRMRSNGVKINEYNDVWS